MTAGVAALDEAVWTAGRLGLTVHGAAELTGLVGLAVRRNPRRAHLLVSRVLGKHVPADPHVVLDAGHRLGEQVRQRLGGGEAVVLGYAETATALGHTVADALGDAVCLHSTRRAVPGFTPVGGFAEEHSHATEHLLLPADPGLLLDDRPLVLVDDELSTGTTALNTIDDLHRRHPRPHYVIAALVDVRGDADRERMTDFAATRGIQVDVVSTARGELSLPPDIQARARAITDRFAVPPAEPRSSASVTRVALPWPAGLPESGRHGFTAADRARLDEALPALAAAVPAVGRLLVLGTEELMYVPLRLAAALADRGDGPVLFASTTRSPVVAVDQPGYPIRSVLTFAAHDGGDGARYAYNLVGLDVDAVLLVVDRTGDRPALGGLLDALGAVTDRILLATVGTP
ncbi:phosphoribosyltransferase family protein [Micromonosporaceae bacterium Da 78-11]